MSPEISGDEYGGSIPTAALIPIRLPQLENIERMLVEALAGRSPQRWYTLDQAWGRKYGPAPGGVSKKSLRGCLALQPKGGRGDGWQSGRKCWTGESIDEWASVDDEGLEAYLARYAPDVKVPPRIRHAIQARFEQEA